MMQKCDYCMYRDGCIGELPGPDGRCMAFAVAKEDATGYETFLAQQEREKELKRELFRASLDELEG